MIFIKNNCIYHWKLFYLYHCLRKIGGNSGVWEIERGLTEYTPRSVIGLKSVIEGLVKAAEEFACNILYCK